MEKEKKKMKAMGRVIALMAVFFLSFILTSSRIWAFEIDTSSFSTPSKDVEDFYYWHEGLPPDKLGTNGVGLGYPTLITWSDKYYWATDVPFYSSYSSQTGACSTPKYDSDDEMDKWGEVNGEYHLYVGARVYWSNYWPHGNYRILCDYPSQQLSGMREFDFNVLKKYGTTISFELPEIPVLYAVDQKKAGVDNPVYFITGSGTGASRAYAGQDNTYAALHYNSPGYCNIFSPFVYIRSYVQLADYYLGTCDYRQKTSIAFYPCVERMDKDFMTSAGAANKIKQYCWQFIKSDSKYGIRGEGYASVHIDRISEGNAVYGDYFKDHEALTKWSKRTEADMVLKANGEYLRAHGDRNGYTSSFKIYYAEWNPITYLNESFTVQNGQVTSLEGPIVIPQDTTITVQDGGVLSIKGWVINNGRIIIESGGTMLTQEDAVVSCTDKTPGKANGQISCDGLMILSSGSKVCAGGIYGMSFGEGAQCVNYGVLISENFSVATDHTIENRTKNSAVFAGWGISDSGYNLQQITITGSTFETRTTIEKTRTVSIPTDGVYGPGANRLYKNADPGPADPSGIAQAEGTK